MREEVEVPRVLHDTVAASHFENENPYTYSSMNGL